MWKKAGVGPLRGAMKAKRRIKGKWDDVTAGSGWWGVGESSEISPATVRGCMLQGGGKGNLKNQVKVVMT